MKNSRIYNSLANTAEKMEKEIKFYARHLCKEFDFTDYMVEITGYDFDRSTMNFDITFKRVSGENECYSYAKGFAGYIELTDSVTIDITETDSDRTQYNRHSCAGYIIPAKHGFGAIMMAF